MTEFSDNEVRILLDNLISDVIDKLGIDAPTGLLRNISNIVLEEHFDDFSDIIFGIENTVNSLSPDN